MSDQPEPLSAILAEMRDFADHRAADAGGERPGIELLRSYADRIEAAAERERVEIRRDAEIEWTRIGYDERKAEERRAPGNAAAMQRALNSISDIAEDAFGGPERYREASQGRALSLIVDTARAALSKPARNCDRSEFWEDLWLEFGKLWPDVTDDSQRAWLFVRWLFATAKGGDHA